MLQSLEQTEQPANKPRILVLSVRDSKRREKLAIAHVVIERKEILESHADGQVKHASIELSFRLPCVDVYTGNGRGEFQGSYSPSDNSVSLSSRDEAGHGFVTLDLPGLEGNRIGTYLMNEIVRWAKQWPDADVRPIELLTGQAGGENQKRRIRFYERFGLFFDYGDTELRTGISRPMKVRELQTVDSWKKNIDELHMFDFLAIQEQIRQQGDSERRMLEHSVRSLEQQLLRAQARPIVFATIQIFRYRANWLIGWCLVVFAFLILMRVLK